MSTTFAFTDIQRQGTLTKVLEYFMLTIHTKREKDVTPLVIEIATGAHYLVLDLLYK